MSQIKSWIDRVTPLACIALALLVGVAELINRAWVAHVFFQAGQLKLASWDATLFLFQEEYQVPLLPPELAAYLGTAAELILPIFLVFGLGGRFAAGALFIFNFIAFYSYPGLNAAGIQAHQIWGLMLLVPLFRGPGLLSLDQIIVRFAGTR